MAETQPTPQKTGIKDKIIGMIEEHPVIVAAVVAGVILGIITLRNMAGGGSSKTTGSGQNQLPVYTDASGNPIDPFTGQALPGASVSPQLSQTDIASMLQDMEQQILNWEQNFQPNPSNSNDGGSNPTPPPNQNPTPPTGPTGPNQPVNPPVNPPITPTPTPPTQRMPAQPVPHGGGGTLFATVAKWLNPNTPDSSLWQIWKDPRYNLGMSWAAWEANVLRLNPNIHNPNLLHPGEKVRIR